jgi:hypothetical protein
MHPIIGCNRKVSVAFVEFFCKGTHYVSPSHTLFTHFMIQLTHSVFLKCDLTFVQAWTGHRSMDGGLGVSSSAIAYLFMITRHHICPYALIDLSGLKSAPSTEQCMYNVPTKNKYLTTNNQQTVAMSNNEDMEVDFDRGHGLQGTNEKTANEMKQEETKAVLVV